MRAGITILPEYPWSEAEGRWRQAEEYGFAHAWTFDHLGWRELVDGPWFGSVPTVTAAALATSRIELGLLVATPAFRHPVPFARELTALDDISRGRFTLGLGAGGGPGRYDHDVFGGSGGSGGAGGSGGSGDPGRIAPVGPDGSRAARFAEFTGLLDTLLTTDGADWHGTYYTAEGARNGPGCVRAPRLPFVVAANGPKAMDVAARYGEGWITTGTNRDDLESWWASLAELSERFDAALERRGRPRAQVRRFLQTDGAPVFSLGSASLYAEFLGRAGELGFTDVVAPWPRAEGVFAGSEDVLDTVAADVLPGLER
ncbi:LLM class flavin-dependent oxidoreductase [Streptomyces cacaoi]|uniref:LLM class flavin-dependent oxidoreductase n=1 Tax=Streptomyces cacaoi TaxID=1898 RepID=UPI002639AABC|nr:LLM class flavin-dependent oxidoreductase [Streptomyces cacaoi]